jgi:hypothetical protein
VHDKKLLRIQWGKGYITNYNYFNIINTGKTPFDKIVLQKLYPTCTEDQIK